ncbi:protein NRT1/ PTR FAMILY 2.6-like isoform X2 [Andrographis paniculata]|nr:protein NRT1/ PTR FAMILY 2.6-like isoform X2 [Andrographis paniculata]
MAFLTLSAGGWINNLIVYLIQEFNMKSISAAKIFNFVNGSVTMLPIVGAVVADSFFGCFSVIWFSSILSLLGVVVMVLTAAVKKLQPPTCETIRSNLCIQPTGLQYAVLYFGLSLASLGTAGTRFTIATIGADQFAAQKSQGIFFNWYIFTMYVATVISSTGIVYVEDNASWTLGFSLCAAANILGLAVFLSGIRFYSLVTPRGSPYTSLARVIVVAVRRRRMILSPKSEDYYHEENYASNPTPFFSFLNRAALRTEEVDTDCGSATEKSKSTKKSKWCTVREVEDLKRVIKLVPLWSTGLLLCTPLAIQLSLSIIQALTMDRQLTSHFKVPSGSMPVFILISTSFTILVLDRFLFPFWSKLPTRRRGQPPSLLRRVGVGHAFTIISMAISAIVESKRLQSAAAGNKSGVGGGGAVVPMSAMWLVPQLAAAGAGEALHFPAQIALYYQEFPESMKSTATAAVAMFIGIAFYMSNGVIDLVGKATGWLPDDINEGRLDYVYWLCCVLGGLNFVYFLVCASLYEYQNIDESAAAAEAAPPPVIKAADDGVD